MRSVYEARRAVQSAVAGGTPKGFERVRRTGCDIRVQIWMRLERLRRILIRLLIDAEMANQTWAAGEAFTLADCAAAPPLLFASKLVPFGERHNLAAYFRRLSRRPSVARAFNEAEPFLKFFPG